jgi:4-amino-4-deoxy-L-arabinose transferase-like glycosyltransferase
MLADNERVLTRTLQPFRSDLLERLQVLLPVLGLLAVGAVGFGLRLWNLDALGFNSDEAVYAGQAAAIASDPALKNIFPIFRAHPLLFQWVMALTMGVGVDGMGLRVLSGAIGMATVGLVFLTGRLMYGWRAGLLAALFLAVMPYHVVVTRQVLLDGPMTLCATLALYMVAKFAHTGRAGWLYAAGAAMGLTFLAKETGVILLGAIYAFLALSPEVRVRLRDLFISVGMMVLVIAPFPISLVLAGGGGTSRVSSYLVWQLFRRANHDWAFYPTTVPIAIGLGIVLVATVGLFVIRRWMGWREKLLFAWILVPVAFFEVWPVKGFQYPLPIVAPMAVVAAVAVMEIFPATLWRQVKGEVFRMRVLPAIAAAALAVSLALGSWSSIQVSTSGEFLAGSGGVPGGREAGLWVRNNVPEGATLMTIGPSMANILEFYGHRLAYGLSVSPNPLHRNPSYDPINNPDFEIRTGEIQYVVWDSFSALRSTFFASRLRGYAEHYHGRVVHTESIPVTTSDGQTALVPVIVIYEVRP